MSNALLALAAQHLRRGELRDAEVVCRKALAENQRNADAWQLLGVIAGTAGQPSIAADFLRQALTISPTDASTYHNLVLALLALGELTEALNVLNAARDLGLQQTSPQLLTCRAMVLIRLGQLGDAVEVLRQAAAIAPRDASIQFHLGEACRRMGDTASAIEAFRAAMALDPNHADACNNLSGVLLAQGDYVASIRCLEHLLALRPQSCQTYCNLGAALRVVGDIEQSLASFRQAAALDPEALAPRFQLANLLVATGAVEEGEQILRQLSEERPDSGDILAARARILERHGKIDDALALIESIPARQRDEPPVALARAIVLDQAGRTEEAVSTLEGLADNAELLLKEGWSVRFRLGHGYDRLGRFDDAFRNIDVANQRRRAALAVPFSLDRVRQQVDPFVSRWTADTFENQPTSGLDDATPIFIVGMPRSGTSLVEQILASHPDVHGCGELGLFGESLRRHANISDANGDEDCPSSQQLRSVGDTYLAGVRQIVGGQRVGGQRVGGQRVGGTARATDKMPFNFQYVPWIRRALPGAVIIHCTRHPWDICLSCYFHDFLQGNEFSYDLGDLATYYSYYQMTIDRWRAWGIGWHEVQYEDLVQDPEPHIRALLTACGLDWEPRCLEAHRTPRLVATASYQQVRQPIYRSSVARWRNYEAHLSPLRAALGDP